MFFHIFKQFLRFLLRLEVPVEPLLHPLHLLDYAGHTAAVIAYLGETAHVHHGLRTDPPLTAVAHHIACFSSTSLTLAHGSHTLT